MSDGKDVKYEIGGDPAGYVQAMQKVASATAGAASSIDAQFKQVGETFASVHKQFMSFAAVLAGGGALKTFITDANEWNGSAAKMAKQLSLTTEQASVLNVALRHIGVDSETYVSASEKLSKQIYSNGDAFKVLGVKVQEVNGQYRPVTQVMAEVNAKLAAIKNPIEQNIAGQQVYGKGWAEIRGILKLTIDVMQDAETRGRELGLIVGPEGAAMSRKYTEQLRDLNLVGKAIEVQFGNELLPIFTQIGSVMSKDLPQAASSFGEGLKMVMQTFLVLGANVKFVFESIGREMGAVTAQMNLTPMEALRGGWKAISDAVIADGVRARAELDAFEKKVMSVTGTLAALNARNAGGGRGFVNPDLVKPKEPHYTFKEEGQKATKQDPSYMKYYELAFEEEKRLATERDALHGMSKEAELQFWNTLLQSAKLTQADQVAVQKKASEARIEILKQEAQQADELGKINLGAWEARALAKVAVDEEDARNRQALGQLTQEQLLQQEAQFEQRRAEIRATALQAELASLDPTRDVTKVAAVNAQLEALEQEHQLRMRTIRGQMAVQSAAEQGKVWGDLSGRVSSLWDQGVNAMMNGTLTWRSATQAVGTQLVGWFANSVIKPQIAQWVLGETAKTGATVAGAALRTGAEAAASATSIALWAMTAVKNIMANAWAAMAAAWQAMVGIPVIGPVLAVAAAATAFAGVAAIAGRVASAEGGYDIPAGVNPMTQLHEKEMVLPAKHADVIRDMADGGGGGMAGGGWKVEFKGTPMRGGFFMMHRDDMVAAINSARRDGAIK